MLTKEWYPIRLKGLSGVVSIGLNQLWVMYWTISAIGAVIEVCKYHSAEQLAQELTPRRAVSYLRVSTREQARRGGREEGFSIPAQRAANKRKAMSIGAIIGKEFTEGGVSATTTRRPALQAMLRYL